MKVFLRSFFEGFFAVAPYVLVLLVLLETILAITSSTLTIAALHAFAAIVNGFVVYYHQTRGNI